MTTRTVFVAACLLAPCTAQPPAQPAQPRPQQAGQPVDPLRTAGHLAAANAAALTGDQAGVQRNVTAMSEDMRRAMKLPDANRPIDRETAHTIARALPGVRSANWLDRHNLMVRIEGAHLRTFQTIDTLCWQLEPHGDTLGVVVHPDQVRGRLCRTPPPATATRWTRSPATANWPKATSPASSASTRSTCSSPPCARSIARMRSS